MCPGTDGARRRAVLASANRHKLEELREALPGWEIEPLEAAEWPEETGETYYENALLKARFGRRLGDPAAWVLGEDSGIECAALEGAPGLHSARWAPGLDQADALLARLDGEPERRARMVTVLVALAPDGDEVRGEGVLEGELATERRGEGGFGYDPIFVPAGDTRTVAQIGDAWKRRNSHRARAAHALEAAVNRRDGTTRGGS
jgi:XTP/dITP diphosphohydrolase